MTLGALMLGLAIIGATYVSFPVLLLWVIRAGAISTAKWWGLTSRFHVCGAIAFLIAGFTGGQFPGQSFLNAGMLTLVLLVGALAIFRPNTNSQPVGLITGWRVIVSCLFCTKCCIWSFLRTDELTLLQVSAMQYFLRHAGLLVCFLMGILLSTCQKPTEPQAAVSGPLTIRFSHTVGSQPLLLDGTAYTTNQGESFTVTKLSYYVSNVALTRRNGSTYLVPQDSSYFLIRAAEPGTQRIVLARVPAGDYMAISFLIGVDSLRNTKGIDARKGVLDPARNDGMYWDWNSGYIFFKFEGVSPQAPPDPTGIRNFIYHVGLFGGYTTPTQNNLRTVRLSLGGAALAVGPAQSPVIDVQADLGRVFNGPNQLRIGENPRVMVSPLSAGIADNYARMFQLVSR